MPYVTLKLDASIFGEWGALITVAFYINKTGRGLCLVVSGEEAFASEKAAFDVLWGFKIFPMWYLSTVNM